MVPMLIQSIGVLKLPWSGSLLHGVIVSSTPRQIVGQLCHRGRPRPICDLSDSLIMIH